MGVAKDQPGLGQRISKKAAENIERIAGKMDVSKSRVVDGILTCIDDETAIAAVTRFSALKLAEAEDSDRKRKNVIAKLADMAPEELERLLASVKETQ